MAISFSCESCAKAYQLNDALAGKKAKCKQCGHEFRIPQPAVAQAASIIPHDIYGLKETPAAQPLARHDTEFRNVKAPKRVG